MDAATGCPTGDRLHTAYEEMFTTYFDMVKGIVLRAGIQPVDVEDVAMEIITTFMKKEGLEKYDPVRSFVITDLHGINKGWTTLSKPKTATFKGMLRGFARVYVMAHRDKQMMRAKREPLRLEKTMPDGSEWGASLVEGTDCFEDLDIALGIRRAVDAARFEVMVLQQKIDQQPKRGTQRRDLLACFDLMIAEGYMSGRLTRKVAAEHLGVSEGTVGAMLKEIKDILRAKMDVLQVAMP